MITLDYPQFVTIQASTIDFEVDHSVLDRVNRKEFGEQVGISVISKFHSYENSLLTIITEIKYVGIKGRSIEEAVASHFLSSFQFKSDATLKMGVNEEAVDVLKKCYVLAQGHAYGIFSNLCQHHGVPQSGMELSPATQYEQQITDFLKTIEFPVE